MFAGFRTRRVQRADSLVVADLLQRGCLWEVGRELTRTYEVGSRVVALSGAETAHIRSPDFVPEPIPTLGAATFDGTDLALIGGGLVVVPGLSRESLRAVHRLARTLASQELGARWCVITIPVPTLRGYEPAGVVQQIAAGSFAHPEIDIPLEDGYWPIGIVDDGVVLVRRNEEF